MKKNSPVDFSQPRRQSYSAILFFIYRFFKIVIRQIWPILLAFLFGREEFKTTLLYVVIGISILILIYSIIAFFKYYFYIANDELIVEKGVFQKSRTNIPFERIQTINVEQTPLHQVLNVVKIEIDTAGSKGSEFSFAALSKDIASELRQMILSEKAKLVRNGVPVEQRDHLDPASQHEELVMQLSLLELIRIGFVQNHLRSFLLILIFFSWIIDQLRDIGLSPDDMIDEIDPGTVEYGTVAFAFFAVMGILLSLLISLTRTVLRYYNFRLFRTLEGFKIESGLFNRRQVSARDHKIQIVSWADNPLKRILRLFDVHLKQASSVRVQNKKSIVIPGCNRDNLEKIKNYYFSREDWVGMKHFKISPLFIQRKFLYAGLLPFLLIFGSVWWIFGLSYSIWTLIWPVLIYFSSVVAYRKNRFSINEHLLLVQHGLFGNYHKSLKLYKIQNISLQQSIYQRRKMLADLNFHTASGSVSVPYVEIELAQKMVDFIIYKIETDRRNWM